MPLHRPQWLTLRPAGARVRVRRWIGAAGVSGFAALVVLSSVLQPAGPPAARAQAAPTATNTSTSTATVPSTVTRTPTRTATATPSQTSTPTQTSTSTQTHTATPTATETSTATAIVTSAPTGTTLPLSTSTPTPVPPAPTYSATIPPAASPTATVPLSALNHHEPCDRASGAPATRWEEAFTCMATVGSARVSATQRQTTGTGPGAQVRESTTSATLSGGDADVTHTRPAAATPTVPPGGRASAPANGSNRRRVTVGGTKFDKDENASTAARRGWQQRVRPTPAPNTKPFGPLTLADGTSLGASALYTDIRNQGTDDLPQGRAHRLEATLNMAALASAGRLSSAEQTRYAQGSGLVTVWVAQNSALIYRTTVRISLPAAAGGLPTVQESTVDVTDHNAALTVVAPQ